MLWLFITISAYFLFAITALLDKYLLLGPPNPKIYSFYVGILSISALLLIPFVGFSIPNFSYIILSLTAGALFIGALFVLYTGLERFEASRIISAIGGILPLFTFILVLLSGERQELSFLRILAFLFLISGSVLITFKKEKSVTLKSLSLSALAAFLFSLSFILTKFVYLSQPFWSGFIWMRIGGFLAALCFIFTPEVRKEIFTQKSSFKKKTGALFLFNQAIGSVAFVLQNWAIALVPLGFLTFITALEGTKYVFLLILTILASSRFPTLLKEEFSKSAIRQKLLAILLIIAGLVLSNFP